ncbi:MAG: glycoside hydrolase family 43 protein [Pyrinomonadaceae bacterium]
MSRLESNSGLNTYLNPVYPKSFPDPFVLKFCGEYFGYCTGFAGDGSVFGIVRSHDLVTWTELGGAMAALKESPPYYWAPEVVYDNGRFYLYYSVGNETLMELRVAVSDRPDGGFIDSGHRLTTQDFAIDAHVFVDDDGSKFLFYATDFLDHSHIGTGTVMDRMLDWFTLEGNPRPVTRALYDWQVYDPNRKEKGGVRWHTVEGPTVLKRKGLYYEMFSGGNWQNTTYGVSFATSSQLANPDEWFQFSDGENSMPILRTIPEVVGPGHNSVVRGPNNRELFCVYHQWTGNERVMAIDRMDFAGDRIFLVGATHTSQPAPIEPNVDGVDAAFASSCRSGEWSFENHSAISGPVGRCEMHFSSLPPSFLCETNLRCAGPLSDDGSVCVDLATDHGSVSLTFHPNSKVMRVEVPEDSNGLPAIFKLPEDFDWTAPHILRVEADFRRVKIELDGTAMPKLNTFLGIPLSSMSISSENQSIALLSFELTEGFEELFEESHTLTENGWSVVGISPHRIEGGELMMEAVEDFLIEKQWPVLALEFAANLRVLDSEGSSGEFGLLLRDAASEVLRFSIERKASSMRINGEQVASLPAGLVLDKYHQLRIIKNRGRALCYFDDALVHDFEVLDSPIQPAVFCEGVQLAIEMIRLTVI